MNTRQLRSVGRILVPGASLRHIAGFYDLIPFAVDAPTDDIRLVMLNLLKSHSGLTAITDRIYLGWLPQKVDLPAITITIVDEENFHGITKATTINRARVQVDLWSYRALENINLKKLLLDALHSISGTVEGTIIYKSFLIGDNDFSEAPRNNSDKWTHRISCEFELQYKQSLPSN